MLTCVSLMRWRAAAAAISAVCVLSAVLVRINQLLQDEQTNRGQVTYSGGSGRTGEPLHGNNWMSAVPRSLGGMKTCEPAKGVGIDLNSKDPDFAVNPHFCKGVFQSMAKDFVGETTRMTELLQLKPGMVYCEVAAAGGLFAMHLGRKVMPGGRLYLTVGTVEEVQAINDVAQKMSLANVTKVKRGTLSFSGLPEDGQCDVLMSRMSFHFITVPDVYVRQFYAALRPGGLALISDHRPNVSAPSQKHEGHMRGPSVMLPPQEEVADFLGGGFHLVEAMNWPYFERGYAHLFSRSK